MFLSKKETFLKLFTLSLIGITPLEGEITLGLLISIRDNSSVMLKDNNQGVECIPMGVKTLENLINEEGTSSECGKSITEYYHSHPHERSYAQEHLHMYQKYHYEKGEYGCALYSNGTESYSEQLLNEGLAIIDPKFDDREWNTKLRRAHTRAKVLKKGIFEGDGAAKCIKGEKAP